MSSRSTAEFRDYDGRNAYNIFPSEIGNVWTVVSDHSEWRAILPGVGAQNWVDATGPHPGEIVVPIISFVEIDGEPLIKFKVLGGSATPGLAVDGGAAVGIRWNPAGVMDAVAGSLQVPSDLSGVNSLVFRVVAHKTGATLDDAVSWDLGIFPQLIGQPYDVPGDIGGQTTAMVGDLPTKTVQSTFFELPLVDVPEGATTMTVTVKPTDGTLDVDNVTMTDLRCGYVHTHLSEDNLSDALNLGL